MMDVLVIEDDQTLRSFLVEALSSRGFEVTALANAEDALVLLGAGQVPDVLVADINLGAGLDGVDLADMARGKHPDVGVVLISGEAEPAGGREGAHQRFLRKPFTADSLVAMIRDAAG